MKNKNINFEKISNIFSEKLKYNTSKLLIFIFCKKKIKKLKKVLTSILNDSIIEKFRHKEGTKYIEK